jgi:hypothetical protein
MLFLGSWFFGSVGIGVLERIFGRADSGWGRGVDRRYTFQYDRFHTGPASPCVSPIWGMAAKASQTGFRDNLVQLRIGSLKRSLAYEVVFPLEENLSEMSSVAVQAPHNSSAESWRWTSRPVKEFEQRLPKSFRFKI